MPLLVGTDGVQKMSKSPGNYIGVDEPPNEMYGKVMSIPDSLLMDYFELVTDVPDEELTEMRRDMEAQSVNPMELKKRLALNIVAQFHDGEASRQAEQTFEREVQRGEVADEDMKLVSAPKETGTGLEVDIIPFLVDLGLVGRSGETTLPVTGCPGHSRILAKSVGSPSSRFF